MCLRCLSGRLLGGAYKENVTKNRRHAVRLPVRTLVCNLDYWNEATILNVSESGLALEAMAPVNMNRPAEVILDWTEMSGPVTANGEVVWHERGRSALRFTGMGETSRIRLVEWLFHDLAARLMRPQRMSDSRPHGLGLPAGRGRHFENTPPARPGATPGQEAQAKLRLSALLTAEHQVNAGEMELAALLDLMAKRAQYVTQGSGAAIALGTRGSAVCMASSGELAPSLGVTISSDKTLAGTCLQSGEIVRCDDAHADPRIDPQRSLRLGIRSALLVPLHRPQAAVTGVLGVFSERKSAFDEYGLAALERMRDVIVELPQLQLLRADRIAAKG